MPAPDTIFALSSGRPPAAVAVLRISGPRAGEVATLLAGSPPFPRAASVRTLRDPASQDVLDRALTLFFPAPRSATGEDVLELHLHGGRAAVARGLRVLADLPGLRPAAPREFTRRAHANGKLDLAEVEGLADLVAAESEAQRRQALAQASGALSRRVVAWRSRIVRALAFAEAGLDFADEGDVADDVAAGIAGEVTPLLAELREVLADAARGERVRDGVVMALAGPPNAGKSTLLNHLAGRDAAIVSPVPGTTRDVVEVHLELAGQAVTLLDTAGLRETIDPVETEGVRRALARAEAADLVLWLSDTAELPPPALSGAVCLLSKADLDVSPAPVGWLAISVATGRGLPELVARLEAAAGRWAGGEPALVTRERQRLALAAAASALANALAPHAGREELQAEELRLAAHALDRLIGKVDVEDVLDSLFSTFCIGK